MQLTERIQKLQLEARDLNAAEQASAKQAEVSKQQLEVATCMEDLKAMAECHQQSQQVLMELQQTLTVNRKKRV